MTYTIIKQYFPGSDQIWVASLGPDDPILTYDNSPEAEAKAIDMQNGDSSGRKYKVKED